MFRHQCSVVNNCFRQPKYHKNYSNIFIVESKEAAQHRTSLMHFRVDLTLQKCFSRIYGCTIPGSTSKKKMPLCWIYQWKHSVLCRPRVIDKMKVTQRKVSRTSVDEVRSIFVVPPPPTCALSPLSTSR